MGIDINIYTIYGVKLEYDEEFSEAIDDADDARGIDLPDDFPFVLFDGMSGEYMILGKKLFDSGNFRWSTTDGDTCIETDPADLEKYRETYIKEFIKYFPKFRYLLDDEWQIISIIHYG